jgi:archaellum component FlaC
MNEINKRLASIEDRLQDIEDSLAILTARAEDPSDHVTLEELREGIKSASEMNPILMGSIPNKYKRVYTDE